MDNMPDQLSKREDLSEVFDTYFFYADMEDPEQRKRVIASRLPKNLVDIANNLHAILTKRGEYNFSGHDGRETGRDIGVGLHGLNRIVDFKYVVVPELAGVLREIADDTDSRSDQSALELMANVTATMVAESQTYSDGSHRIARALRTYIAYGPSGLDLATVFARSGRFYGDPDTEELFLHQNITRLEGAAIDEYSRAGGIYVNPSIIQRLDETRQEIVKTIGSLNSWEIPPVVGEHNHASTPAISHIIRMRGYGEAAAMLGLEGNELRFPMEQDVAMKIGQADRKLHLMRQMSLLSAVSSGVVVEITEENNRRVVRKLPWIIKENAL